MHPVTHLTQSIARPPAEVAAFAREPENLPRWASGLSAGIRFQHGDWVTDSPMGQVIVRFVAVNELGVLDHDVLLPDGTTVHNPVRVLPNGDGSEIVFTLFRLDGVTDEAYEVDAATVRADLARLRDVLEAGRGRMTP